MAMRLQSPEIRDSLTTATGLHQALLGLRRHPVIPVQFGRARRARIGHAVG